MKTYFTFLIIFILLSAACVHAQISIIANKSVPVNSIEMGNVNQIYLLKARTWSNGTSINPIILKSENETCKQFFSALGTDFMEMKKFWMKLQLTGAGKPPEGVGSEDEVISKVESTPGAIGFVNASKVNSKVKVLLTFQVD
jgi:ABC-type phosphate transport system substrate-binding protein